MEHLKGQIERGSIVQSVIILNIVKLSVDMVSVSVLRFDMLNVIMLSVVGPYSRAPEGALFKRLHFQIFDYKTFYGRNRSHIVIS